MDESHDEPIVTAPEVLQQLTPPPTDSQVTGSTETHITEQQQTKRMDIDEETGGPDMLSPMSAEADKQDDGEMPTLSSTDLGSPSMGYDFSNVRVRKYATKEIHRRVLIGRSSSHPHVLPFCVLAANIVAPNNLSAKSTTCRWRSSMWT